MINGAARESSQETNDTNVLFSDKSRFCIQTHDSHLHVQQRPGKWHLPENIYSWYRPNHWYHGVGYHKLQCTHIVSVCRGDVKHHHVCWRLFNRFYWYSCNRKAMCCSSKIMPIYIMPLLLKIFWNMVANFPGWHDCHNLPHPH